MTRILAIDASTEACSVALFNDNEITDRHQLAPREHARLLLPMIDELLARSELTLSQLDAIACHVGPGAFTGIRIAVSVAQGLAFAANLPTIALSTLANLACQGHQSTPIAHWYCAIDARMSEIYYAEFSVDSKALALPSGNEIVVPPLALVEQKQTQQTEPGGYQPAQTGLIGNGWVAYKDQLLQKSVFSEVVREGVLLSDCLPSARFGLEMAKDKLFKKDLLEPQALQPVYLRNQVAAKKSG